MKWSHRNGWRNVQTTRKKRSMLKKQGHHHLQHHQYNYYSGSVLLCEIYHQTFYDPFIFCVSLRFALLLQSCFKWWESRKIMKCVTTWGSLWKMFVQKLWAAATAVMLLARERSREGCVKGVTPIFLDLLYNIKLLTICPSTQKA